jgi:two-component system sensor histidine kinase YesM
MELGNLVEGEAIIQRHLRNPLPLNRKTRFTEELEISSQLYFIHNYTLKDIFGIYVLGVNGGQYRSNSLSFQKNSFRDDTFFRNTIIGKTHIWMHTESQSIAAKVIDENFISVSRPVIDRLTGSVTGIVIVETETNILQRMIDSAAIFEKSTILLADGEQILCMAGNKDPIRYGDEITGPKGNRKMYLSEIDQKKYMTDFVATVSGFQIMSLVPLQNMRAQSLSIVSVLLVFIFVVLVLSLSLDFFISSFLTKPIKELSLKMSQVENGNLNIHLEPRYRNEIGSLVSSFNSMIKRTRGLMERIILEQKKINELNYKVLQEQIKPHFLYNTLDSAIWLSRDNKNDKVIELVTSLIHMMRLSLNDGKDIITIEDEIEQIRNYLFILKIRYDEKLSYGIAVSRKASNFIIPKLTLQPFVENAVYHGIKNKEGGGIVSIDCALEEEKVHFVIRDTGVGIDENELRVLNDRNRSEIFSNNPAKRQGIGIKNVSERLYLHFKEESRVWIESVLDQGTSVHIIIPQRRVNPDEII